MIVVDSALYTHSRAPFLDGCGQTASPAGMGPRQQAGMAGVFISGTAPFPFVVR